MQEERFVCSSCGRLIAANDEYCPSCSAPTAAASNLDPMKLIESEGRLFVRATEGKQKPIVLIGIWILFLPFVLVGVFSSISILMEGSETGMGNFVFFWGGIGLAFIGFTVLYRVTTNYFGWNAKAVKDDDEQRS